MSSVMRNRTTNYAPRHHPVEGVQTVSPKQALMWFDAFRYEHQRKIRNYHVNTLAHEMSRGRFLDKTSIHFCVVTSGPHKEYALVNGQHTLQAIIKSDRPANLMVIVNQCETWAEVADQFARHDTHLTRQLTDSLAAHEVDSHFGITKTELKWITAATLYYAYIIDAIPHKAAARISHDSKLNLVMDHGESFRPCLSIVSGFKGAANAWATRKTTFAAMRIMYEYDPTTATLFWRGILEDDGLKKGDPRKALLRMFQSTGTAGGGADLSRRSINDSQWMKAISLAWNAYAEHRSIAFLKVPLQSVKTVSFTGIGAFRV
jgi:hypothetical protein